MATILLSIKPEYVKNILSGVKKYEYRKHIPQKTVDRIIIYSSAPDKKVIGEVSVLNILEMSPTRLWENTKQESGITRSKFRAYFKGSQKAFAFQLGKVIVYDQLHELSDYGVKKPPQSFVYV